MSAVRQVAAAAVLLVTAGLLTAQAPASAAPAAPASATAISGSEFDPGFIISDANFYNAQAMTASEIQIFLDSKIGACQNGRCLNVSIVPVPDQAARYSSRTGNLVCEAFGGGSIRVSELIYRVQVACGISARAILVTLQKEQGLVTSRAPSDRALRAAMGMACPDTAPCDTAYAGLATQIITGTAQLKTYKAGKFAKQPGVQYIQYNPNASCGGTTLNVRNYATAALYSYTPYQPNAAALANLGGVGNSCSSYGNRNFWYYYYSWFGSPTAGAMPYTNTAPMVAARNAAGDLLFYVGNGRGGWAAAGTVAKAWQDVRLMTLGGDFDGNGNRDLLAVRTDGSLWLYQTDGYGQLEDGRKLADGWGGVAFLVSAGDLTGDGRDDLISVTAAGVMTMYPITVGGVIGTPRTVDGPWAGVLNVIGAGDFDGDRRNDLLTVDTAGRLWLHRGTGAAAFLPPIQIGTDWTMMSFVGGARDFDGDGAVDLIARTNANNGDLWLYRGDGRGGWRNGYKIGTDWGPMTALAVSTSPTPSVTSEVGFGDVDADGPRDILSLQNGTLWNYRGIAGGHLGPRAQIAGDWTTTRQLINVGDYDRDGFPDVLSIDDAGIMWRHSLRDGLQPGVRVGQDWNTMTRVFGAGDFNGDGFGDVMAVNPAGELLLYAGPALGATRIGTGFDGPTAVVGAGDFDNDGAADVLVRTTNGDLYNYRGDGAGSWAATFAKIGTGWNIFDLLIGPGDFDGDGYVDVMARKPNGELWLYPSNGKGDWKAWRQVGTGWNIMRFMG